MDKKLADGVDIELRYKNQGLRIYILAEDVESAEVKDRVKDFLYMCMTAVYQKGKGDTIGGS